MFVITAACVNSVRWSWSGTFLASGGDDKLIMIWQTGRLAITNVFNPLSGNTLPLISCSICLLIDQFELMV